MDLRNAWTVLLMGGVSGTGKSTVAKQLGQSLGVPWFQVDDLRLAFQRSRVQLPVDSEALYFFADIDDKPDVWAHEPHVLCDALISVTELLSPALEAIVENHVDQHQPIVIEGDGIAPSLLDRAALRRHVAGKQVQSVFLVELDEEELYANMLKRGRGIASASEAHLRAEAHAKALFGQWLADEAARHNLPVLEARPWETLIDRITAATNIQ